MSNFIRVGVIGVGKLGSQHARIYHELPGVELVGICDIHSRRLARNAKKWKTEGFSDYRELAGRVDAVSVVVPTGLHYEVGRFFLEKGVHILIEKPIAPTMEEARELHDLSQGKKLILQVGHVERFNAAVVEAQKHVSKPRYIEAHRLGPFDPRTAGVGVVLDLMIHDLDIILYLVGSRVASLDAVGTAVMTKNEDIAMTHLIFENGCWANITASRVTLERVRKIRIFESDRYLSLDYLKQKLKIYEKKHPGGEIRSFRDIVRKRPRLAKSEPLAEELKEFVLCVREGKPPSVSAAHGRDALELALEILQKIKTETGKG